MILSLNGVWASVLHAVVATVMRFLLTFSGFFLCLQRCWEGDCRHVSGRRPTNYDCGPFDGRCNLCPSGFPGIDSVADRMRGHRCGGGNRHGGIGQYAEFFAFATKFFQKYSTSNRMEREKWPDTECGVRKSFNARPNCQVSNRPLRARIQSGFSLFH